MKQTLPLLIHVTPTTPPDLCPRMRVSLERGPFGPPCLQGRVFRNGRHVCRVQPLLKDACARLIESGRKDQNPSSLHPLRQILGPQMGVSLQHLHRLVPCDAGDLHGVEPLFLKEPGCGLMAHIV